MSPRNTAEATIKLLKETACHRLLVTSTTTLKPLIDKIRDDLMSAHLDFAVSIEEVPSLHEVYPKLGNETEQDPFEPYPAVPARPSLDEVCNYLHSSGSTGLPKSIPQTFRAIIHWSTFRAVPSAHFSLCSP